ncbi:HET domain-containing protein [Microdochium nivale]|nr:HET domain-containing protein [Microdochium nivale]
MGTFAYVPIQCAGPRPIRLLRLAPLQVMHEPTACANNVLQCQLIETSLDKAPPYIAISHAWAHDTKHKAAILVNGRGLTVSQTLADLLAYLRKYCRPRNNLFWIDALCINHRDNVERALQVSLMRHIYERAWVLIAWLGTLRNDDGDDDDGDGDGSDELEDDEPDVKDSLKDVHSLHGFFQAYAKSNDHYGIAMKRKELRFPAQPYAHRTKEVLVYEIDAEGSRINIKGVTGDDLDRAIEGPSVVEARLRYHIHNQRDCQEWTWTRISKLLSRPWFRRTWLVQEIYCARNVQLALGAHMISWTVLAQVCRSIAKYGLERNVCHVDKGDLRTKQPLGFAHILALDKVGEARQKKLDLDLASMMLRTCFFETADARDMLYSLLSLIPPAGRAALEVNYELSNKELCIKLTSHLIMSVARPAELLFLAGIGWETSVPSLPSWVPNWTSLPANLKELYSQLHRHTSTSTSSRQKVTSGAGIPTGQPFFFICPDLTTLRTEGYIVDKVQYLITNPAPDIDPSFALDPNSQPPWTDWMLDAVDMIRQGATTPYPTGEALNEVLWRTLITSQTPSSTPAGPEYGISFRRSIGRPFESTFSYMSTEAAHQHAQHVEEKQRLLQMLAAHVESSQISPGRAYIERMSYSSPQTFLELEKLWKRSYDVHGRGKCLFTTKRGFVGLAAPGLARGGDFYIAYLRDQPGSIGCGDGRLRALVLKREPCHEITPKGIIARRIGFGPGSRKSSSGDSCSTSASTSTNTSRTTGLESDESAARGPEVPRFRLVSECYLHGGYMLRSRARDIQKLDIY